jgi:hypothetical protein
MRDQERYEYNARYCTDQGDLEILLMYEVLKAVILKSWPYCFLGFASV